MKMVQCEEHGTSPCCLIRKHLREGRGLGYFAIAAEPDGPAQAWCEACDRVLSQERGWNDRADNQADWKLYCTGCYERRLGEHALVGWIEGTRPEGE